jgi:hypothetical protein
MATSALGGGQRTHCRQELVRPGPIHHPQERLAAMGQQDRPPTAILGLGTPLDESPLDEAVHEPLVENA